MAGDGETLESEGEVNEEAEDNRKESILASTPSLQPNFKRSSITHQQISKLQELHKRRMQIKAKSKIHKKAKGDGRSCGVKNLESRTAEDRDISAEPKDSGKSDKNGGSSSTAADGEPKKLQKLHWGLGPKERWERKSNM